MTRCGILIAVAFLSMLILSVSAAAQHGTAPAGYFPMGYSGDTWSGTVSAVNPDTRETVLTYKSQNKEESFTGVLKQGYTIERGGKSIEVELQKLPLGSYMVAYYMAKTKNVDGKKTKYYEIFRFDLYPTEPKK